MDYLVQLYCTFLLMCRMCIFIIRLTVNYFWGKKCSRSALYCSSVVDQVSPKTACFLPVWWESQPGNINMTIAVLPTTALVGNRNISFQGFLVHPFPLLLWKELHWPTNQPGMFRSSLQCCLKYFTKCDLLEPQQMIVELLLERPFLVHHVGTKWVITSFLFLASVPFPPRFSGRM